MGILKLFGLGVVGLTVVMLVGIQMDVGKAPVQQPWPANAQLTDEQKLAAGMTKEQIKAYNEGLDNLATAIHQAKKAK